jgi:hypothetical protein
MDYPLADVMDNAIVSVRALIASCSRDIEKCTYPDARLFAERAGKPSGIGAFRAKKWGFWLIEICQRYLPTPVEGRRHGRRRAADPDLRAAPGVKITQGIQTIRVVTTQILSENQNVCYPPNRKRRAKQRPPQ